MQPKVQTELRSTKSSTLVVWPWVITTKAVRRISCANSKWTSSQSLLIHAVAPAFLVIQLVRIPRVYMSYGLFQFKKLENLLMHCLISYLYIILRASFCSTITAVFQLNDMGAPMPLDPLVGFKTGQPALKQASQL